MSSNQQDIKTIRKNVDKLKEQMAAQRDEEGGSKISNAVDGKAIQKFAQNTGKGISHFLHDKKEQAVAAKNSCESTIKARPFVSTAAAFAGGLLIAVLLKRK